MKYIFALACAACLTIGLDLDPLVGSGIIMGFATIDLILKADTNSLKEGEKKDE